MKKYVQHFIKSFFIFFTVTLLSSALPAQSMGNKVSFKAADGNTYGGKIIDIQNNQFKIKYDGIDFEAWLIANQFTVVNTAAPAPDIKTATTGKLKTGDRVEVDKAGINSWEKGTVMPFLKNDITDGSYYRVRLDNHARGGMYLEGLYVRLSGIRLSNDAPYQQEKTAVAVGKATVDADNTLSADRAILQCPVQQTQVSASAKPDVELFKKIIRCNKGEKPAYKGYDGAVTVDVTALQLGTPRKWQYLRDIGGKPGVIIYPVKATFTYKTFYRSGTEVSENWIRIINFYVNEFREWTSGSEESIKMGETKNIIRE